jgi:alpha-tubulin suppressor-like RCC1 family protein
VDALEVINGVTVPLSGISMVAVGGDHACALTTSGGVKCWGGNDFGQLGTGTPGTVLNQSATALPVADSTTGLPLAGATAISSGTYHTCALLYNGTAYCWGLNTKGQLGIGSTTSSPAATPVLADKSGLVALPNIASISAGMEYTCATMANGEGKCWGFNNYGQLGINSMSNQSLPTSVTNANGQTISDFIAITAGIYNTCAIVAGHGVQCWGVNIFGQLGNGTADVPPQQATPADSLLGSSIQELGSSSGDLEAVHQSSSRNGFTCAIDTSKRALCWGYGNNGGMGTGVPQVVNPTPSTVNTTNGTPLLGIDQIAVGAFHACALLSGKVMCWGSNMFGELGDNTPNYQVAVPHPVSVAISH